MGKKQAPKSSTCNVCGANKPTTSEFWDDEHIVPRGFGNDFLDTKCQLFKSEHLICRKCNNVFNFFFDEPFLKCHKGVSTRIKTNMKGKSKNIANLKAEIGSAFVINPCTSSNHLFECLKIAFESHLKFLAPVYRDSTFRILQQLMTKSFDIYEKIVDLKNEKNRNMHRDTLHAGLNQYWIQITNQCKIVFDSGEVFANAEDIARIIKERANESEYASLVFIFPSATNKCVLCAIYLQSLPPVVVRISELYDRYIADYGLTGKHIMDIRTSETWVGFENGCCSIPYTTRSDYERRIKNHLAGNVE